nr:uncharacterized protein LOC128698911 isoform X2 [Cherax quadricarinatus]
MVRSYKRKTERSSTPADIMFRAAKRVKCEHKSIRGTARDFAIPFRTLARYCKKITDEQLKGEDKAMLRVGYAAPRQVLSDDQEKELSTYLKQAADIYYGLSVKEVRKLAYQFAESASKTIPPSWKKHKMAGSDWFSGFLKRNKDLSIRSPETTSLSRAAGISPFNKDTFQGFDFLGAYLTDRPQEDQQETQVFQPAIYLSDNSDGNHTPQSLIATVQSKSCSVQNVSHLQDENEPRPSTSGLCGKKAPTPEELRPLHKAGPRKRSGMNRRKHSAAILTETPVKKTLEKISKEAKKKQPKKSKRVHGDRENSDEEDSLCLILAATRIPEKLTTMPPASG